MCVQVPGVSPDPVVVWTTESGAKAFIEKNGGEGEFQALAVNEQSMEQMARALGCPVESITVEQYPAG